MQNYDNKSQEDSLIQRDEQQFVDEIKVGSEFDLDFVYKNFPPSTVNNSRSIVRALGRKMNEYPSESLRDRLENITGKSIDYSNKDVGEEPAEVIEE